MLSFLFKLSSADTSIQFAWKFQQRIMFNYKCIKSPAGIKSSRALELYILLHSSPSCFLLQGEELGNFFTTHGEQNV